MSRSILFTNIFLIVATIYSSQQDTAWFWFEVNVHVVLLVMNVVGRHDEVSHLNPPDS